MNEQRYEVQHEFCSEEFSNFSSDELKYLVSIDREFPSFNEPADVLNELVQMISELEGKWSLQYIYWDRFRHNFKGTMTFDNETTAIKFKLRYG